MAQMRRGSSSWSAEFRVSKIHKAKAQLRARSHSYDATGYCYGVLGRVARGRAAWQRSVEDWLQSFTTLSFETDKFEAEAQGRGV